MVVLVPNSKEEFEAFVEKAGSSLVIVDFYAPWCGPCKIMGPKFEKMSNEYPKAVFMKINVDEQEEMSDEYEINVMPTFVFIKNKQKVQVVEGNLAEELRKAIEELIGD